MFVVLGEALIDLVIQETGECINASIGGGPLNSAIALARLEQPVSYLYPLSYDFYGQKILRLLQENKINYACPYLSSYPTPLAMVKVDEKGVAHYHFYRENTADRDLQIQKLFDALPPKFDLLHTGTLAIANQPDVNIIEALIIESKKRGALVSVDPNMRPKNLRDKAQYIRNVSSILTFADLIKLSDDDAFCLYPDQSIETILSRLQIDYPLASLLVLTRGKDSISCHYRHKKYEHIPQFSQILGDTIGAGDCFIAGLLYKLNALGYLHQDKIKTIPDQQIKEILMIADRVAGLNTQRFGCQPPYLEEVETTT